MVAKSKDIEGFDEQTIRDDLKKEDRRDVRILYILMEILFSPCIMDIAKNLESDFKEDGNRHYPRLLLLGIVMYCFANKIYKYKDIVFRCKMDRFLRIYTRGAEPCESTFRNFLNSNKSDEFRKIFLYTLLRFNEYDLLKFLHAFIDGTDAIVRGSRYHKIYKIELEAMKFMAENNLLHNGKHKYMKEIVRRLIRMKMDNPEDEKLNKMINIILPRIHIYTRKIYKKIDVFEEAIEKSNKDFVCITYPNAGFIKCKKRNWNFAKNLQMAVSDNKVILGSIFINDPDDSHALEKLIPELRKNFEMLAELVAKYGTRNNTQEIKNLIKQAMIICDSGYDSQSNVVFLLENEYKSLIMPKITARYTNRQLLKFDKELENLSAGILIDGEEFEEFKKSDMPRIWNGLLCKNNRKVMYFKDTSIPEEENKDIPKLAKRRYYKYKCLDCSGCPLSGNL